MVQVVENLDLRPRNTFGMRATAARWVDFTSDEDVDCIFRRLDVDLSRRLTIGQGSNLLFATDHYDGTILHSRILTHEAEPVGMDTVRVTAGSGIRMDTLCEWAAHSGLWGLENLSLIPGEVGAAAVQNVGAYGCEAGDLIEYVDLYDTADNTIRRLSRDELSFAYRMSLLKQPDMKGRFIVLRVAFLLSTVPTPRLDYGNLRSHVGDNPTPTEIRDAVTDIRRAKLPDPADVGSAGSFFKNPVVGLDQWIELERGIMEMLGPETAIPHFPAPGMQIKLSAAWLIDHAGLKGATRGGAAVWQSQPLVIVNASGDARWQDVADLRDHIIDTVRSTFGVTLTPEVEQVD